MEVIDTLHITAVVWRKTWHVSDSIVAVHPARNPDATGLDGTLRSVCANRNHRIDRNGPFRWCLLARQFPTKSIVGDWQVQPHMPGQYRYIDLEAER